MDCPVCGNAREMLAFPINAPEEKARVPCPACRCPTTHENQVFDRAPCPDDACATVHRYCADCGAVLDDCYWNNIW